MRWKLVLEASQTYLRVTHTCPSMGGDYTELGTALGLSRDLAAGQGDQGSEQN